VVSAIVSRGGRPDLAGAVLPQVKVPTLLIVGGHDFSVITMNEDALAQLHHAAAKRLDIVPRATHLFEEPGTLEQVAMLASRWFQRYLIPHNSGDRQPGMCHYSPDSTMPQNCQIVSLSGRSSRS
jgi:dienelactone hydrolase